MTPPRWDRVKLIFDKALARKPEERESFLVGSCEGDEVLRREVDELLFAHENAGAFLKTNIVAHTPFVPEEISLQRPRIGPYQVLGELGQGGMGTVYLAVRADEEYRKQVAIKLIRVGADSDFIVRRFRTERQILAGLTHPNIATLLDGGSTADGLPYLVMEYIEGEPISRYCDGRKLSIRQRLEIFRTVCGAVQYAHQNLIVHRDIKPGNIFVTKEGVPKLLDFGLAKLLDPAFLALPDDQTASQMRLMTPAFASPEQIRGQPITTASDIYSLGVLLYLLLTGHRPYRLETGEREELARAVCEQEPTKPSDAVLRTGKVPSGDQKIPITPEELSRVRESSPEALRRRLSGDLDTIVLKALRKKPSRRYASVEQLSEDLRRYLEGRPVSARPDALAYRTRKFVGRHRAGVAAAVLVLLALAAGGATTLWQARRAAEKEALAVRRFNDVRKLANSYLFEFHDAIKDLAGSTPARQLLVKRALEYLGPLAKESGDDPELLREVAEAYMRIGDVQGGVGIANLGDTKGALESYLAAVGIRERLVAARPKSVVDRQALAEALQRASDVQTGAEATRSIQRAVDVLEALVAEEPKNVGLRLSLMSANVTLGQRLTLEDHPEQAIAAYKRMGAICEGIVAEEPKNFRARRGAAIALMSIGQTYQAIDKPAEALESFRPALPIWDALVAENPENGNLKRDYSMVLADVSLACRDVGRFDESIETGHRAVALREALAAADPNDADIRIFLAEAHSNVGSTLARAGRPGEGLADIQKAIRMCQELLRSDPENNVIPDVIFVAYENLGDLHRDLALKSKGAAAKGNWQLAREAYRKEQDTLLELKAAGKLPELRYKVIDEAAGKIALCDKALSGSGL